VKEYKRKEKLIVKISKKMFKIDETIRVFARSYIWFEMMSIFIKKILQLLIIKYKRIDDQIKKQLHEKFQTLKQSSFKNQIEILIIDWKNLKNRILTFDIKFFSISKWCSSKNFWSLIENELQRSATIKFCKKKRLKKMFISQKRFASIKTLSKRI
jgi:hypothetical protein